MTADPTELYDKLYSYVKDEKEEEVIDLIASCKGWQIAYFLYWAAFKDNVSILSNLTNFGASLEEHGDKALRGAIRGLHVGSMKFLLQNGAVIGNKAVNELVHIARNSLPTELNAFIKGSELDINCKNKQSDTPLSIATMKLDLMAMNNLLINGAAWDSRNREQETPISISISKNNLDAFSLICSYISDENVLNALSSNLMKLAIDRVSIHVVAFLMAGGCDPKFKDNNSVTLLTYAAIVNSPHELTDLLNGNQKQAWDYVIKKWDGSNPSVLRALIKWMDDTYKVSDEQVW